MKKTEVIELLGYVRVAFPNSFTRQTPADLQALVNLWYRHFKDDDYKLVQCAVDSIIATDTTGFAPSIGKIKEMINKLLAPDIMTEQEACYVYDALRNSIYNSLDEFEKLPDVVKSAVGSPSQLREWAVLPSEQLHTVVSSNFMRSYRARSKHAEEMSLLPSSAKEMITGATSKVIESKE